MTRFFSLSLFAVVTGVALGMGIAYGQGSSLDAWTSLIPNFHAASPAQYATRRAVSRRIVPPVRANTVQTQQSSSAAAAMNTALDPTCDAVQKTIMKIKMMYNAVTPVNLKNTEMHQKMDAVFADVSDDYCTQSAASSSAAAVPSSASVTPVDNHCENYPKITARYTQCVISNGLGRKFP